MFQFAFRRSAVVKVHLVQSGGITLTDVVSSIARADGDKWVVSVRVYYTGGAAAAGHVVTVTTADAKVCLLRWRLAC